MLTLLRFLLLLLVLVITADDAATQTRNSRDLDVATRFTPIVYQALGDRPHSDYLTKFDFDGDWRGDNNWDNIDKREFPLKAFLYYSVSETTTHFFIHYAIFHPRDYKGGERKGAILSELIREGAKHGAKYDPTGLVDEATLAHENDMEGALVVAKKNGNAVSAATVVFVETLAHSKFKSTRPAPLKRRQSGGATSCSMLAKRSRHRGIYGDQSRRLAKDLFVMSSAVEERASDDKSVCRQLDTTQSPNQQV